MRFRTESMSVALMIGTLCSAQDNYSGFNYQAVVRNTAGDPVPNQSVGVRVLIFPGISNGYSERHVVTTDAKGQISLVMGEGTPEVGSVVPTFSALNWTNGDVMSYTVSVDITGGTSYSTIGGGQFKSVPFALRSLSSAGGSSAWALNGTNLNNTNTGNVGIGNTAPGSLLHVGSASGSVATPTAITLDNTYFLGSAFNKLKFYLYKSPTESYGLGLGSSSDVQYWAGTTTTGIHRFFTGQQERMRIEANGNVGIGTTGAPTARLEVAGSFKLVNGSQGAGKVLTSDANGLATWATSGASLWSVLGAGTYSPGPIGIGIGAPLAGVPLVTGSPVRLYAQSPGPGNSEGGEIQFTRAYDNLNAWSIDVYGPGFGDAGDLRFINANANTVPFKIKSSGNAYFENKIFCREVEVTLAAFPDYVFKKDYRLMPLAEVEAYIAANGHLPNVPSACEVEENGIGLGVLNKILLEKVEELTLHAIAREKEVEALKAELEVRIARLEALIDQRH